MLCGLSPMQLPASRPRGLYGLLTQTGDCTNYLPIPLKENSSARSLQPEFPFTLNPAVITIAESAVYVVPNVACADRFAISTLRHPRAESDRQRATQIGAP